MPNTVDTGPYEKILATMKTARLNYARACNVAADEENGYLRAFHLAWLAADHVAATVRSKHCDNQSDVVEARCRQNTAKAREKAAKAKCEELVNRLMASMSWQRTIKAET